MKKVMIVIALVFSAVVADTSAGVSGKQDDSAKALAKELAKTEKFDRREAARILRETKRRPPVVDVSEAALEVFLGDQATAALGSAELDKHQQKALDKIVKHFAKEYRKAGGDQDKIDRVAVDALADVHDLLDVDQIESVVAGALFAPGVLAHGGGGDL